MTDTPTLPATADLARGWEPKLSIAKWHDSADHEAGAAPDEVVEIAGNLLLNAGITRLLNLLAGAGGTAFNAANCRIGVGDSSTAAAASQTDLQAASNKYYKLADTVTVSAQTVTVVATFGSAVANFAWAEWGLDNGTADSASGTAPMLNRKVASAGTKASGATWVATATITIS